MPYGTLYGLAPSISDRTAFTLCVEPRTAKALHRSSAEPPSSHKPPDSVISNWDGGYKRVTQNLPYGKEPHSLTENSTNSIECLAP
jgi:hypothetical protein